MVAFQKEILLSICNFSSNDNTIKMSSIFYYYYTYFTNDKVLANQSLQQSFIVDWIELVNFTMRVYAH